MSDPTSKTSFLSSRDVDSKWSWFVCFASFVIQFVILGIQSSFGAFFIEFLNEFKKGESSTAWIGSVAFGLTFMNGPLATWLCSRWGSRTVTCLGAVLSFCGLMFTSFVKSFPLLFLTYGVVFGLGSSFSYFASIAGLTSYFKKRLSLAYGISLAGSGAGTPVMIVLLEYMIKRYGWRVTFQITAAITTTVFIGGLTYLPINSSKPMKHDNSSNEPSSNMKGHTSAGTFLRKLMYIFDPAPFKDRAFVVWVAALGFCIFGYFIPFVFVIRIAKDIGVSSTKSTLLIAYLSISQTICKILFGRLGDFARERRIVILQLFMLLQAIVTMLCPLASKYGYVVLVIYVVVFGISDGCWSVMLGMGTELIVGKSTMPRAFGSLFGVISIPLIVGPPVAGVIFDLNGSYDAAFILAGATVIIGILLMFVVQRLIHGRPLQSDSFMEIKLPANDNMLSCDDAACVMDEDKRFLVYKRELVEFSRPSSLVVSRVLEDLQYHNDSQHITTLVGLETATQKTNASSPDLLKSSQLQCLNTEKRLSTYSSTSSACAHSDSGTYSIGADSLASESLRVSTGTDSDFVDNTSSRMEYPISSSKEVQLINTYPLKRCCASSLSEDVFSSLMEQALEEDVFCSSLVSFSSNGQGSGKDMSCICFYHGRSSECQETVV